MLYQSGYLTIKSYDQEYNEYMLDYPNDEVRKGFMTLTANSFWEKAETEPDNWVKNLSRMFKHCDLIGVRDAFTSFLSSIPYEANKDERAKDFETHFSYTFYIINRLLGCYISKQVFDSMPVYCFLFLRYVLATILMLIIWKQTILNELKKVPIQRYIVPAICMSCAFIFSNMALKFTAATNVSFIRSLSAILAPLLLVIFYKQTYKKHDVILQLMMVIGLYLLCAKGGLHGFGIGEVLSFVAALLVAGSLVFGKTALDYVSAKTLSFVQTAFAILVCGIMSLCTGSMSYIAKGVNGNIILALLYAAIACTIGGYMLQNVALKHISSKIVGIVQSIYPIATAVMAYFVLNEKLSLMGLVGAFIIGVCVVIENMMASDK